MPLCYSFNIWNEEFIVNIYHWNTLISWFGDTTDPRGVWHEIQEGENIPE